MGLIIFYSLVRQSRLEYCLQLPLDPAVTLSLTRYARSSPWRRAPRPSCRGSPSFPRNAVPVDLEVDTLVHELLQLGADAPCCS